MIPKLKYINSEWTGEILIRDLQLKLSALRELAKSNKRQTRTGHIISLPFGTEIKLIIAMLAWSTILIVILIVILVTTLKMVMIMMMVMTMMLVMLAKIYKDGDQGCRKVKMSIIQF